MSAPGIMSGEPIMMSSPYFQLDSWDITRDEDDWGRGYLPLLP